MTCFGECNPILLIRTRMRHVLVKKTRCQTFHLQGYNEKCATCWVGVSAWDILARGFGFTGTGNELG